jgi:hypothetical protein
VNIQVSQTTEGKCRSYVLTSEKVTMQISVCPSFVNVGVLNAMHKARRGPGKAFHGPNALVEAAKSYKSDTCKAMVEWVAEEERTLARRRLQDRVQRSLLSAAKIRKSRR